MIKDALTKPEINFMLSILVPLIIFAVGWGVLTQRVDHLEAMTLGLQNEYDAQRKTNEDIKIKLAEIQKDILFIRERLESRNIIN